MVIYDCSTTMSCDVCSEEFTVSGKIGKVRLRKSAHQDGWRFLDGQDVCPRCAARRKGVRE